MALDLKLPDIDGYNEMLPISGQHGACLSYYQPDELDLKALEYASILNQQTDNSLCALDLGCSPYFPQSQRFAKLGFQVDAIDLIKPVYNFTEINQRYHNRIAYKILDLKHLQSEDLMHQYQIVYSNRCFSFLSYSEAHRLIRILINHNKYQTRYFLAFFSVLGKYAENYPVYLPLAERYVALDNAYAKRAQMLAPVCLYTREEILHDLLGDLPISLVEIIEAKSGSLKIIFET